MEQKHSNKTCACTPFSQKEITTVTKNHYMRVISKRQYLQLYLDLLLKLSWPLTVVRLMLKTVYQLSRSVFCQVRIQFIAISLFSSPILILYHIVRCARIFVLIFSSNTTILFVSFLFMMIHNSKNM